MSNPELLNLQRKRKESESRSPVPWLKVLLFLIVVLGAGAAYYQYIWIYRLPQQRKLTDSAGHTFTVTIKDRVGGILKLSASDQPGGRLLIPIKYLAETDQDFVQKLPAGPALELPLAYALKGTKEYPETVMLQGDNAYFVQYTTLTDKDMHYMPLSDLDVLDRAVIQELPANFDAKYPIDYTLTDKLGVKTPVRLEGRNSTLVKYTTTSDEHEHLTMLSLLSAQDQAVLNTLPTSSLALDYPVEYAFTNAGGQAAPVKILGRSRDLVEYVASNNGDTQWQPISKLAPADRSLVLMLPSTLQNAFPLNWKLTDSTGRSKTVWVSGRSVDMLQYIEPAVGQSTMDALTADAAVRAGDAHYLVLASLSGADMDVIRLFPASLRVAYPLTCTVTGQDGRPLKMKIIGQTHATVRFTSLPTGKPDDMEVANLSEQDQAFLQLLPKTLKAPVAPPPIPAQVQTQEQTIGTTQQKIARLQKSMTQQNLTALDKLALQKQIDASQADIDRLRTAIAKNFADRITQLQQEISSLQSEIDDGQLNPDEKAAAQDKISTNTQLVGILQAQLNTLNTAGN